MASIGNDPMGEEASFARANSPHASLFSLIRAVWSVGCRLGWI